MRISVCFWPPEVRKKAVSEHCRRDLSGIQQEVLNRVHTDGYADKFQRKVQ